MLVPESMDSFKIDGNLKKATWGSPTISYHKIDVTELIKSSWGVVSGRGRYIKTYPTEEKEGIFKNMDPFIGEKKTLSLIFGSN